MSKVESQSVKFPPKKLQADERRRWERPPYFVRSNASSTRLPKFRGLQSRRNEFRQYNSTQNYTCKGHVHWIECSQFWEPREGTGDAHNCHVRRCAMEHNIDVMWLYDVASWTDH